MNVYTYFSEIDYPAASLVPAREKALLQLWSASWRQHGWTPVVLTEADATPHAYFDEYLARVASYPCINPAPYNRACFLRWLAMSRAGGGMMTDYDVINYGWTPQDRAATGPGLVILDGFVPCAVSGPAAGYMRACLAFADHQPGASKHVSDMQILKEHQGDGLFTPLRLCREYNVYGWEAFPLVHYATNMAGRDKAALIQRVRPVSPVPDSQLLTSVTHANLPPSPLLPLQRPRPPLRLEPCPSGHARGFR